ncbi:hypothetical protein GUJ93_ZPchr0009g332 [Zizania palustris]|uniref:Rhodanese domain-containing protein n=1 Tax=Zizania palustris TaxID=103762 RepID=A0A8J5UYW6_ZIZPA|nr:hypothetical protein GUJ93_ZPchr0009g332 [Zizania palustris]
MLAARSAATGSSVVKSNLACSPRISSCSCCLDFTSAKLRHARAVRSPQITCAATKPAKSPAEEDWKIKRQVLVEKRVRSADVKEALRLQKENNFVILDVRPEAEFKEAHPPGAVNVQVYRLIKEWTAWDIARRAGFAFFGIFSGTEENPEFIQSMETCHESCLYVAESSPVFLYVCHSFFRPLFH